MTVCDYGDEGHKVLLALSPPTPPEGHKVLLALSRPTPPSLGEASCHALRALKQPNKRQEWRPPDNRRR